MVKRSVPGAKVPVIPGQVTWSRFKGPKQAWREAKKRAGLNKSNSTAASSHKK